VIGLLSSFATAAEIFRRVAFPFRRALGPSKHKEGPSRNFTVASKGDESAPVRVRWNVFIDHLEREPDYAAWHLRNNKRW
jgi:hypothetical protein